MRLLVVTALGLTLVTGAAGCKGRAPLADRPIGEAEASAFAQRFAADVIPCDGARVALLLDTAAMARRVTPPPEVESVALLATEAICAWLSGIESYRLVRVQLRDGRPQPIMRRLFVQPSGAMFVNYDRLELARSGATIGLADVFSYRQGKWVSDNFTEPPAPIREARERLRAGDYAGALVRLAADDAADVRATRDGQLLQVSAAAGVSPERLAQELDELAKQFPDDPVVALTQIDAALGRDDHVEALRWIDLLAKEIGGDAYLDAMRAVALVREGEFDAALAAIDAAVAAEPTLTRAHEIKLDILIARKQWDDVLAVMTELEHNHGMTFEETKLRAEPRLAELVSSPAFAEWLARR
jgi:cellobiose-specific phosphotransferase system component IIA